LRPAPPADLQQGSAAATQTRTNPSRR
jgi:hypothetical protein